MNIKKNKLIIAAAGSGKTSTIVKNALEIKGGNVLITTFTEANKEGIKKRVIEVTGGFIPKNITIQTWFSFLLQHCVRPYQSAMNEDLWGEKIGFYLISGSSTTYKGSNEKIYSRSKINDFFQYYFISKNNLKMYSDKVSEFAFECDKKTDGDVIKRISKIYPNIFIDEVQDLAGYDLEILKLFFESQSNILLVGDPRQGTYSTHSSKKNKKFEKSQIIHFFDDDNIKKNVDIDDASLTTNYRSNENICTFSNKLFPNHKTTNSGQKITTGHDGIFLVEEKNIDCYLKKYPNCIQLRWDAKTKTNDMYKTMNFGESKGLDFDRVLIYPTNTILDWIKNNDSELASTTRSKFYVAITRARYSVGIVYNYSISDIFEGIEKDSVK